MLLDEYRRSMMMMQQRLGWQGTLAMMLVLVVVGLCNGCVCVKTVESIRLEGSHCCDEVGGSDVPDSSVSW